jgi:hypothetical protein
MTYILSFILLSLSTQSFSATDIELSKAKEKIIQRSIASYSGTCPCPYNVMRNGKLCGRQSAYSRFEVNSPICFVENISDLEAKKYLIRSRSH